MMKTLKLLVLVLFVVILNSFNKSKPTVDIEGLWITTEETETTPATETSAAIEETETTEATETAEVTEQVVIVQDDEKTAEFNAFFSEAEIAEALRKDPELAEEALKFHSKVIYTPGEKEVIQFLKNEAKEGDVIFTMGAGDIFLWHQKILKKFLNP